MKIWHFYRMLVVCLFSPHFASLFNLHGTHYIVRIDLPNLKMSKLRLAEVWVLSQCLKSREAQSTSHQITHVAIFSIVSYVHSFLCTITFFSTTPLTKLDSIATSYIQDV